MKTGRTFAVGDIHGAARALQQCFDRSNFDFEKDELISLGDLCDGWSEVKEAVDLLLKCKNRIDIKGNHDLWFTEWLTFGMHSVYWMHGGHATAQSYARAGSTDTRIIQVNPHAEGGYMTNLTTADVPKTHVEFFEKQHLHYVDNKNKIFVHGGFNRVYSIKDQDSSEFLWNRNLWKNAMSCTGGQKLITVDGFDEIFIGHTATTNFRKKGHAKFCDTPMNSGGVWNLDTGAGFNGKLTFMNVDTKEYFQSDTVIDLYPEENGRNR